MDLSLNDVVKYVLEGCAVAAAAFYLPQKKTDLKEVAMIGMIAAVTFFVLDLFAPSVAAGTRQGSGFGIGYGLVGGAAELEEMEHMKNQEPEAPENEAKPEEAEKSTVDSDSSTESSDAEGDATEPEAPEASGAPEAAESGPEGPEAFAGVEPFVSGFASI